VLLVGWNFADTSSDLRHEIDADESRPLESRLDMPLYEYLCNKCGHKFEEIRKFSDKQPTKCPKCGGVIEQLISAPTVQFKGSGWYVTDYAKKGSNSGSSSSSSSSDSSEGDTSSAELKESKDSKDSKPAKDSKKDDKPRSESSSSRKKQKKN
jgi:putative FmdB family regulatory protein